MNVIAISSLKDTKNISSVAENEFKEERLLKRKDSHGEGESEGERRK